jgi:hypothetical protein
MGVVAEIAKFAAEVVLGVPMDTDGTQVDGVEFDEGGSDSGTIGPGTEPGTTNGGD